MPSLNAVRLIVLNAVRLIVLWLAASSAGGLAHGADRSAVRSMMIESGMVAQFAEFDDGFRDLVLLSGSANPTFPAEHSQAFADIVHRAMEDKRLILDIEEALANDLTDAQIQAVRHFYTSPVGDRLKQAEIASSGAAVQAEIGANLSELRADLERDPKRLALARESDEATFASKIGASLIATLLSAMLTGALEAQQTGLTINDVPELRKQLSTMRSGLENELRDYNLALFHRMYRDVTVEDLEVYAGFQRTEASKATYAAVLASLDIILAARGREIGREFADYVKQKRT